MMRFAKIIPVLGIAAFITVGRIAGFQGTATGVAVLTILVADVIALCLLMRQDQASPIHKALGAFILLAGLSLWLWPEGAGRLLGTAPASGVYLVLFLFAVLPPLFGREPFTVYFARKTTPEAVWQTDVFRKINRTLTMFWAMLFFICTLLGLIPGVLGPHNALALILFEAVIPITVILGLGLPVTRRYPAWYQRKLGLSPMPQDRHRRDRRTGPTAGEAAKPPVTTYSESLERREGQKMSASPTIVAINGSPHEGIGNTSMMIEMLRQPLSKQGFDLEVIYLCQHDIGYCQGCGFCLERGKCWIDDDHRGILERLSDADGIILGSPVYIMHVTAQMKTFLDRSLAFGHKPRASWKPGLAVCVSAGLKEVDTALYLANALGIFGAFSVGTFTAIATSPGEFIGKEAVEARARDLARDLAGAVREKRRYPATEYELRFYQFMGDLVKSNKDGVMKDDFEHWEKHGLFEGFEAYVQQKRTRVPHDNGARQAWIKEMIARHKEEKNAAEKTSPEIEPPKTRPELPKTCRELLKVMPLGFRADAAEGLSATYQFEVTGEENFVARLKIHGGTCTYHDGPGEEPSVIIKTPADIWLAIANGDLDGQQAFMGGKYTVEGDLSLLMRLKTLFSA